MDEQGEIELTQGGQRKLGNLVNIKDMLIADAIRQRGGGQGQIENLKNAEFNS